jgi:hypothetical protein
MIFCVNYESLGYVSDGFFRFAWLAKQRERLAIVGFFALASLSAPCILSPLSSRRDKFLPVTEEYQHPSHFRKLIPSRLRHFLAMICSVVTVGSKSNN